METPTQMWLKRRPGSHEYACSTVREMIDEHYRYHKNNKRNQSHVDPFRGLQRSRWTLQRQTQRQVEGQG